jgi:phosphoadenosine phosphosulfate reductase
MDLCVSLPGDSESGPRRAAALAAALSGVSLEDRVALIREAIPGRLVFTTGFGLEGQAIAHALFSTGLAVEAITIDTGRLFPETLEVWAETEARYGRRIEAIVPDKADLEKLIRLQGSDGYRRSVEGRIACCDVRKVRPLDRLLAGASGWISGLRSGQSRERSAIPLATFDAARGLIKANPLGDWDREAVLRYIAANGVPYNRLHDRGYLSVGCSTCTRSVRLGEPERAGRWWWEEDGKKECGLHLPRPARPTPVAA